MPDPYTMTILHKPKGTPMLRPNQHFKILTYIPPPMPEAAEPEVKGGKGAKGAAKGKPAPPPKKEASAPLVPVGDPEYRDETRWVIPARSTIQLAVRFSSHELGTFNEVLNFDVLSGERMKLPVSGICDYPRIASDHRNVYYKTTKARPSTPLINRQYVITKSVFEFGPVLAAASSTGYLQGKKPDHAAKFRITNCGHFPLEAEFLLKSSIPVEEPPPSAEGGAKPDPKAKGKAPAPAAAAPSAPAFLLNPTTMTLKVDETQDLQLFAFPADESYFEDVVICRIKDNPNQVEFPVAVQGTKPTFQVRWLTRSCLTVQCFCQALHIVSVCCAAYYCSM